MSSRNEPIEVTVKVMQETEKAVLVTEELLDAKGKLRTSWLPKAYTEGEIEKGKYCKLTIPRWLFEQKDLTSDD